MTVGKFSHSVSPGTLVVGIGDTPNLDAFSRLRVSDPAALFAVQCQYDAEPLLLETGAAGTGVAGAWASTHRMVYLTCTAGVGTSFIQSYEYVPYQPGRSQLVFVTGLLTSGVADTTVDVGLFDANNGIFLRQSGSALQIVRRTSTSGGVVDNAVNQGAWNADPLDGTGPSGFVLDPAKVFILVIDAQFLGMGRVRVGFDINGQVVYAHEFLNANVLASPYMQTLTLPVQMLLTASGSAAPKGCYFKCASVSSEGGFEDDLGYDFATPEGTVTAASGARTHILSLRSATTFNTLINRSRIRVSSLEIQVTGSNSIFWELTIGSTFSVAPTFTAVNATYSAAQYGTGGTLSAAGLVIASGYASASASVKTALSAKLSARYPLTLSRAGSVRANGTMSLLVSGIGGTSATRAAINFSETR